MRTVTGMVLVMAGLIAFHATASQGSDGTGKVTITLKSAAEVTGNRALLGDVAVISGGTEAVEEYLSNIVVCTDLGESRTAVLRPSDIVNCLSRSRIDLNYITVDGAVQASVASQASGISSEDIKQAVIEHIHRNMPWDDDAIEVEFTRSLSNVDFNSSDISIDVDSPLGCDYLGYEQFTVRLLKDGEFIERYSVPTRLRVQQKVVVASRMISRNSVLDRDVVELRTVELSDTNKTPLTDIDEVSGKRITTTVPAGRVIYHSFIEEAPVVGKDQYVVIRGKKGAISISTRGKALEEGKTGECIRVLNLSSSQVLIAKVTGQQTVDIIGMSVE